jgi:hypothetical protein
MAEKTDPIVAALAREVERDAAAQQAQIRAQSVPAREGSPICSPRRTRAARRPADVSRPGGRG